MAKQNNSKGKSLKKSKFTEDEKLAFRLGKIQASLNKDCRVADSYNNGRKSSEQHPKKKKPLY